MRLICPKCDAQYDIADDVIPEGGRDVQCSSCAHTWFQMDKPKVAGRPLTQRPKPRQAPGGEEAPRHKPIEGPQRKPLDSSIADILREEAAREKHVPPTEEAKPHPSELPTRSASERAAETRRRIAQMTGVDGGSPAEIAAASTGAIGASNVRAVPGIDEINETLRARALASDDSGLTLDEKQEVVRRRGFRRGFFIVLLLLALAFAPYYFADQIIENMPQTTDIMTTYVGYVDQLRLWLDDQLIAGQAFFESLSAETPPTTDQN